MAKTLSVIRKKKEIEKEEGGNNEKGKKRIEK